MNITYQKNRKKKIELVYRDGKKIGAIHKVEGGYVFRWKPASVSLVDGIVHATVDNCKHIIEGARHGQ